MIRYSKSMHFQPDINLKASCLTVGASLVCESELKFIIVISWFNEEYSPACRGVLGQTKERDSINHILTYTDTFTPVVGNYCYYGHYDNAVNRNFYTLNQDHQSSSCQYDGGLLTLQPHFREEEAEKIVYCPKMVQLFIGCYTQKFEGNQPATVLMLLSNIFYKRGSQS